MSNKPETPEYPDVLGMITGGPHCNIEAVQCAFAIFPENLAVGQAVEALILLQNACDKPVQVAISLNPPKRDAENNRISMVAPKEALPVSLQPGEVGLLHVPLAVLPPTPPSENNPVGVKIDVKMPKQFNTVRPPAGGRAASILQIAPFRLNILRDLKFATTLDGEYLTRSFTILPGVINAPQPKMTPRYETLWTNKELAAEQARYEALSQRAVEFAQNLGRARILPPLIVYTEAAFEAVGLPLHPTEALLIAKLLTYTMEDGLENLGQDGLIRSRWFQQMAILIEDEKLRTKIDDLIERLYKAVVHDAVRLGLFIVEKVSGENLGSAADHASYADEVIDALHKGRAVDLSHAYLPLIMAGVPLNARIRMQREDLWGTLTQLKEAWRGRQRLAGDEYDWVAKLLTDLIFEAEQQLVQMKIPRPTVEKPDKPSEAPPQQPPKR